MNYFYFPDVVVSSVLDLLLNTSFPDQWTLVSKENIQWSGRKKSFSIQTTS